MEIFGNVTDTLISGRLEICAGGVWRAVYDNSWGQTEAAIVCGGLGFPAEGKMDSVTGHAIAAHQQPLLATRVQDELNLSRNA